MLVRWVCLFLPWFLTGCVTAPPDNREDLCEIFEQYDDWYDDAKDAEARWRVSIPVMMAIMHQESRFVAKARPPRKTILGFIPGPRPSDAYGYSQAKDSTWEWYQAATGNYGADRDEFADAIDFIGWYGSVSYQKSHIKRDDAYHLYLAYHEGHGGFNRRTFANKAWLKKVAKKVSSKAYRYRQQLQRCQASLERSGWFFGLF